MKGEYLRYLMNRSLRVGFNQVFAYNLSTMNISDHYFIAFFYFSWPQLAVIKVHYLNFILFLKQNSYFLTSLIKYVMDI